MSQVQIQLSGILIIIALIVIAMAFFSLFSLKTPGARAFSFLCITSSIYVAGYAMELSSTTMSAIDFWSKIQYIAIPFIPAIWVILSVDYCNVRIQHRRLFNGLILVIPFITFLLRMTNEWHDLYYHSMSLISNGHFHILHFEKGPWYYVHVAYFVVCAIYALRNYLLFSRKTVALLHKQAIIMAFASVIPVFAILINAGSLSPYGVDVGPYAIIVDYSLFLFGMARYNILGLVPLAREKVFDWMHDGVLVLDMELRLVDLNPVAKDDFFKSMKLSKGVLLRDIFTGNDETVAQITAFHMAKTTERNLQVEMTETQKDATVRNYRLKITKLFEHSTQIGLILIISDITEAQTLMDQLALLAREDAMTGLMNRRYFFERVQYEIERSNRNVSPFSFIFLDLDNFKNINDQYGHTAGDKALRYIADICRKDLRNIDLFTRFGGDEFIIYLPDCDLQSGVEVAERLRASIKKDALEVMGEELRLSASLGVASHDPVTQGDCTDVETILRSADEAMYSAKRKGKNQVQVEAKSTLGSIVQP
jgi:diguanylate cyclase (GGDEF)-like protein